ETKSVSKTLTPGLLTVKINSITLTPGYQANSYRVHLNIVGPDQGSDFEGFFIDPTNPSMGRHKGQVGRVKLSAYDYADGVTKTGIEVSRDQSILRDLVRLATALNKRAQLDEITANSIEEF